jgi:hypothetical protein
MSGGLVVEYVVHHVNRLAAEVYGPYEIEAPLVPDESRDRHTTSGQLYKGLRFCLTGTVARDLYCGLRP